MPFRFWLWAIGVGVGLALAAALPESLFPGVRVVALGLSVLSGVLVGEFFGRPGRRAGVVSSTVHRDTRPADGRVDVATVTGVRKAPNRDDPRFGAFLSLTNGPEPESGGLARPQTLSPPLLGRVVCFSLFIGRDGRRWSVQEVARAHRSLLKAGVWLEGEATRWGAAVNLELADTYFLVDDDARDDVAVGFGPEGEDVGPLEERAAWKALVGATRAAVRLGFRDVEDMTRSIEARARADAAVWLVHPRRAGRSIAVPREDSELNGVSLAVCYARESSFPEPLNGPPWTDPVTVVHELLHLFGATDKYGLPLDAYPSKAVTSREVMRLNETRLSRLRVDRRTAAEIGWVSG